MKKEIIFLGYYCDLNKHKDKILSNADNFAQLGYIQSLSAFNTKLISTNNINNSNYNYIDIVDGKEVTFIGSKNKISKFFNLYNELKKHKDKILIYYNNLFLYNVVSYFLTKKYNIKFIPILITDPFEIKTNNLMKKNILKIKKIISNQTLKFASGVITITNKIQCNNINTAVINGGIDSNILEKYKKVRKKKSKKIKIVYTGALYYRYNLPKIINAVNNSNLDLEFDIYGSGEDLEYIKNSVNEKIKYFGNVSREELIQVQKNADILVAILNNDELSNKTFPSKIFEYIATGNEVIISNLDIIDNDLKKLCHVIEKINEKSIIEKINSIILDKKKLNNEEISYKTLLSNYTWEANSKKIVKLIDEVYNEKII